MGSDNPTTGELIEHYKEYTTLSEREAEVLAHMGKEMKRCETATEARAAVGRGLGIEPSTVDTYYRRALEKLFEAIRTKEVIMENAPDVALDEGNLKGKDTPTMECPECGSTEFETNDLGPTGTAIDCAKCGTNYQVG